MLKQCRFDLIWTLRYDGTFKISEERCPKLDDVSDDLFPLENIPIVVQNLSIN